MLETSSLAFIRNVHINEVSAFCLARDVAEVLRQGGYDISLETIPYDCSLNFLADHHPRVIRKYYEYMNCPKELDELKLREYENELRKADLSDNKASVWGDNLCYQYPYSVVKELREKYGGKLMIDFHNSPAEKFGDIERPHREKNRLFPLGNGYYGSISLDENIDNCHTIEIPAVYRRVPKEILKRRKKVIRIIENDSDAELILFYLERVVNFEKSQRKGLIGEETTKKIAEVIEETMRKECVLPVVKI